MIKTRDYQADFISGVYSAWASVPSVLGVLPTGGGKCLGRDTPVLFADGRTALVQDVQVGDALLGPDGLPRRVVSVCRGTEPLYRVTPTRGDPYVVNESHILSLRVTGKDATRTADGRRHAPGSVVNVDVKTYLASSATFRHAAKGWRAEAVEFHGAETARPLPPYILGVWLGDGNSRTPSICNVDPEVVGAWRGYAASIGHRVSEGGTDRSPEYRIVKPDGSPGNAVARSLRGLNVLQNKHVPHAYLSAPLADRLELLAGLIDTDGYLGHVGYDVVFKQRALADGLAFLARSCGLAAYVTPCLKACTNTGAEGDYYRISISGPVNRIPCRVPRRRAPERKQRKNVLRHGITVEPIGVGDYFGFELEGPDRLFLLGDFTVTHNTVCFSVVMSEHNGACAAVVHRKEIVGQISQSLARLGLKHRVVAPPAVVTRIRRRHLREFGKSFVDQNALPGVVSVQTLTSKASGRDRQLQQWVGQVTLAVFDEGHHYTRSGFWARAVEQFERARLLFVTATPERADGKGLGADADGFAKAMVEGPTTRWLIQQGYLSPFKYYAPDTDLDVTGVALTKTGDFNAKALRARVVDSHLVGDAVKHYRKFADGKRAIVFATDVATAEEIAAAFKASGIPSAALSGETDAGVRDRSLDEFEAGALQVLVNVDLFDEGFDVPGVDAVILARPTESLAKFLQMVGRALRVVYGKGFDLATAEGRRAAITAGSKPHALIVDMVRNWERHGMPDWPRSWSLNGREKGKKRKDDMIPQRVCLGCGQPYEAFYKVCPYGGSPDCDKPPEYDDRSGPEKVDGDLQELDVEAMAALFAKIQAAGMDDEDYAMDQIARGIPAVGRGPDMKRHRAAKYRRQVLRELVAWWVGMQPKDRALDEKHRRFFYRFGVDIGTAFTLPEKETDELIERIKRRFTEDIAT